MPGDANETGTQGYLACLECRRKKSKCDMRRPMCGRCQRVGDLCTFPAKRKTPEFRSRVEKRPSSGTNSKHRLEERLIELLEGNLGSTQDLSSQLAWDNDGNVIQTDVLAEEALPSIFPSDIDRSTPNSGNAVFTSVINGNDYGMNEILMRLESCDDLVTVDDQNCATLHVSPDLATDLVRLYFSRIQMWLPMLHRPRFYARFMRGDAFARLSGHSVEDALLLLGIFALAACHSDHHTLANKPPSERGAAFAAAAHALYDWARRSIDPSSLVYLQGCLALGFYLHAAKPSARSWVLTGVCVRMAYELELNRVDGIDTHITNPVLWSEKEELRRAWWLVWELDAFSSTVTQRPYAVDARRMSVKLPVSDAVWFADTPVDSGILRMTPSEAWKTLRDSPNQDERAWFLISNCIMAMSNDLCLSHGEVTATAKQELLNTITCFSLLLPKRMRLSQVQSRHYSDTFAISNWIIGTHLMLAGARSWLASCQVIGENNLAEETYNERSEITRILGHWAPENISLSHPFLACAPLFVPDFGDKTTGGIYYDMSSMVIDKFAEMWKLGVVLHMLREMKERQGGATAEEQALAKRFFIYSRPANHASPISTTSTSRTTCDSTLPATKSQEHGAEQPTSTISNETRLQSEWVNGFSESTYLPSNTDILSFHTNMEQPDSWARLMGDVLTSENDFGFLSP